LNQSPKTEADALVQTLVKSGIDHCFANPGTSEMSLLEAIDRSSMRAVLCLFEGVCTGAADGFARASGRPASTILHLGPGMANGIANLHNARKAGSPILNLVGNHAIPHQLYDTPLSSDIETLAKNFSCWYRSIKETDSLSECANDAIRAMHTRSPGSTGQIATLIIPTDRAWKEAGPMAPPEAAVPVKQVPEDRIQEAAGKADSNGLLFLGGNALTPEGLRAAAAIGRHTGCRVMTHTFPAAIPLGGGLPAIDRLPYFPEQAMKALEGVSNLLIAGAEEPVSFFAYQNLPSLMTPPKTNISWLADRSEDATLALTALAERLQARPVEVRSRQPAGLPQGDLSVHSIAASVAALAPDSSIVSVDSGGGQASFDALQGGGEILWMNVTGGAIGQAGPVATGAAIARPDQRVIALLGDGAAAYTLQFLWTQAREELNATTIIYNNRRYSILQSEYLRMGNPVVGEKSSSLFSLDKPAIGWVNLAKGFGVPAFQANNAEEFNEALQKSLAMKGPSLIDAVLTG